MLAILSESKPEYATAVFASALSGKLEKENKTLSVALSELFQNNKRKKVNTTDKRIYIK